MARPKEKAGLVGLPASHGPERSVAFETKAKQELEKLGVRVAKALNDDFLSLCDHGDHSDLVITNGVCEVKAHLCLFQARARHLWQDDWITTQRDSEGMERKTIVVNRLTDKQVVDFVRQMYTVSDSALLMEEFLPYFPNHSDSLNPNVMTENGRPDTNGFKSGNGKEGPGGDTSDVGSTSDNEFRYVQGENSCVSHDVCRSVEGETGEQREEQKDTQSCDHENNSDVQSRTRADFDADTACGCVLSVKEKYVCVSDCLDNKIKSGEEEMCFVDRRDQEVRTDSVGVSGLGNEYEKLVGEDGFFGEVGCVNAVTVSEEISSVGVVDMPTSVDNSVSALRIVQDGGIEKTEENSKGNRDCSTVQSDLSEAIKNSYSLSIPYETCSLLGRDLLQMYLQQANCDVCLCVDGVRFLTHKCVLATRSSYFSAMLGGKWCESQLEEIQLQGVSAQAMEQLLLFLYGGVIELCTPSDLMELFIIVDMYGVDTLKLVLQFYLRKDLCHLFHKPCNACVVSASSALSLCHMFNLEELEERCLKWTARYFIKIWSNKAFASLPEAIHQKCVQNMLGSMTEKSVLDIIMECNKLSTSLPRIKWTESILYLTTQLMDSAIEFTSSNFIKVIRTPEFLQWGKVAAWKAGALEEIFNSVIDSLPMDSACSAYQTLVELKAYQASLEVSDQDVLDLLDTMVKRCEKFMRTHIHQVARSKQWTSIGKSLQSQILENSAYIHLDQLPDPKPRPYKRPLPPRSRSKSPSSSNVSSSRSLLGRGNRPALSSTAARQPKSKTLSQNITRNQENENSSGTQNLSGKQRSTLSNQLQKKTKSLLSSSPSSTSALPSSSSSSSSHSSTNPRVIAGSSLTKSDSRKSFALSSSPKNILSSSLKNSHSDSGSKTSTKQPRKANVVSSSSPSALRRSNSPASRLPVQRPVDQGRETKPSGRTNETTVGAESHFCKEGVDKNENDVTSVIEDSLLSDVDGAVSCGTGGGEEATRLDVSSHSLDKVVTALNNKTEEVETHDRNGRAGDEVCEQMLSCDGTGDQVLSCDGTGDQVLSCDGMGDQVLSHGGTGDQVLSCDGTGDQVLSCNGTGDQVLSCDGTADQVLSRDGTADQVLSCDGVMTEDPRVSVCIEQKTKPSVKIAFIIPED